MRGLGLRDVGVRGFRVLGLGVRRVLRTVFFGHIKRPQSSIIGTLRASGSQKFVVLLVKEVVLDEVKAFRL